MSKRNDANFMVRDENRPRRPRGTGGVRQLPSGKFQALAVVNGQRVYKSFATSTEANRWARNTNTDAERGDAPTKEARTITIEQWSRRSGWTAALETLRRAEEERQRHLRPLHRSPSSGPAQGGRPRGPPSEACGRVGHRAGERRRGSPPRPTRPYGR